MGISQETSSTSVVKPPVLPAFTKNSGHLSSRVFEDETSEGKTRQGSEDFLKYLQSSGQLNTSRAGDKTDPVTSSSSSNQNGSDNSSKKGDSDRFKEKEIAKSRVKTKEMKKMQKSNAEEIKFAEELQQAYQQRIIRSYLEEMSKELGNYSKKYVAAYQQESNLVFTEAKIMDYQTSISIDGADRADYFAMQRLANNSNGMISMSQGVGQAGMVLTLNNEMLGKPLPGKMVESAFAGRDSCISKVANRTRDLHGITIPQGGWAQKVQQSRNVSSLTLAK